MTRRIHSASKSYPAAAYADVPPGGANPKGSVLPKHPQEPSPRRLFRKVPDRSPLPERAKYRPDPRFRGPRPSRVPPKPTVLPRAVQTAAQTARSLAARNLLRYAGYVGLALTAYDFMSFLNELSQGPAMQRTETLGQSWDRLNQNDAMTVNNDKIMANWKHMLGIANESYLDQLRSAPFPDEPSHAAEIARAINGLDETAKCLASGAWYECFGLPEFVRDVPSLTQNELEIIAEGLGLTTPTTPELEVPARKPDDTAKNNLDKTMEDLEPYSDQTLEILIINGTELEREAATLILEERRGGLQESKTPSPTSKPVRPNHPVSTADKDVGSPALSEGAPPSAPAPTSAEDEAPQEDDTNRAADLRKLVELAPLDADQKNQLRKKFPELLQLYVEYVSAGYVDIFKVVLGGRHTVEIILDRLDFIRKTSLDGTPILELITDLFLGELPEPMVRNMITLEGNQNMLNKLQELRDYAVLTEQARQTLLSSGVTEAEISQLVGQELSGDPLQKLRDRSGAITEEAKALRELIIRSGGNIKDIQQAEQADLNRLEQNRRLKVRAVELAVLKPLVDLVKAINESGLEAPIQIPTKGEIQSRIRQLQKSIAKLRLPLADLERIMRPIESKQLQDALSSGLASPQKLHNKLIEIRNHCPELTHTDNELAVLISKLGQHERLALAALLSKSGLDDETLGRILLKPVPRVGDQIGFRKKLLGALAALMDEQGQLPDDLMQTYFGSRSPGKYPGHFVADSFFSQKSFPDSYLNELLIAAFLTRQGHKASFRPSGSATAMGLHVDHEFFTHDGGLAHEVKTRFGQGIHGNPADVDWLRDFMEQFERYLEAVRLGVFPVGMHYHLVGRADANFLRILFDKYNQLGLGLKLTITIHDALTLEPVGYLDESNKSLQLRGRTSIP